MVKIGSVVVNLLWLILGHSDYTGAWLGRIFTKHVFNWPITSIGCFLCANIDDT